MSDTTKTYDAELIERLCRVFGVKMSVHKVEHLVDDDLRDLVSDIVATSKSRTAVGKGDTAIGHVSTELIDHRIDLKIQWSPEVEERLKGQAGRICKLSSYGYVQNGDEKFNAEITLLPDDGIDWQGVVVKPDRRREWTSEK